MSRTLLSLKAAAEEVSQSVDTLRRAVKATDPAAFPPPLRAKRDSKGRIFVLGVELERWANSLPDA